MKKKYKDLLKVGVGAAALGASNYLGKRAGEQDIAKKILASYTGDTDTVLKKTSAFGIAKPTARNKGGGMDMGKKKRYAKKNQEELFGIEITDEPQAGYTVKKPIKARFGDFMNTFIADDTRSVAGKSGGADSGTAGEMRSKLGKSDVVEKKKIKNYIKKKVEQGKTVIKKTKEAAKKTGTILATPIKKFHEIAEENVRKHGPVRIYKPRTMNKGGGMDMGAKKPLSFKEQLEKARAEGTVEKSKTSKYLKKKSRGDKINALLKAANVPNMNKGGGMDMGHKPRPRGNPGIVETVVGKGGDYIKDLID